MWMNCVYGTRVLGVVYDSWLTLLARSDTRAALERLKQAVEGVPCDEILGVVVYDLPGRDCAAKASNGELKVGEIDIYKNDFIDRE